LGLAIVGQLPVDGPEGHAVGYQLVACGGDEHDDFEAVGGAVGIDHQPSVGILAHAVDDVLRCWPVARRWRTTSPDVHGIGHRRVKVRWATPLGDETASMS
jgi:hypothetical protein